MAKKKANQRSTKNPKELTIRQLCAMAAGRCEFEGCNKDVFVDDLTLTRFNGSNVAHIVAASPDGPRGDTILSYELSDKLSNLMLMCPEHHKIIDDNPAKYTVEV